MSELQELRTEAPPLKFRDDYIKLPSAKNAIFTELLPEVAVRRVRGNSTLYSVAYRRPKDNSADLSSPLIVVVYQSDLRAKKFFVLLKMKVGVRLSMPESHRFGVAVAVDEVAKCVYVAYTRDMPARSRLLLRRVQLTLAAADARGVRRLQRLSAGEQRCRRGSPRQPQSVVFEVKNCTSGCATYFTMGATKKADSRLTVQQLVLDGAALFLYVRLGLGPFDSKLAMAAIAHLTLRMKTASIDIQVRPIFGNVVHGAGQHKFLLRKIVKGPPELIEMDKRKVGKPIPSLVKFGSVADAACPIMAAACAESGVCQQLVGTQSVVGWALVDSVGRRQIFSSSYDGTARVVAVRGLGAVGRQKIVSVHSAEIGKPLQDWGRRHPSLVKVEEAPFLQIVGVVGGWFLVSVTSTCVQNPSSVKAIYLRANLRSLLPPSIVCAACRVKLSADSKKMCKVCRIRGFGKYSWVFGCHFCSAACLRNAWPQHSRLHHMLPIKHWTDADWKQWRCDQPQH